MLTPDFFRTKFEVARPYSAYVATGKPEQQTNWNQFHTKVRLSEAQRSLVAGFTRRMPVLVISGTWCGDCVQQCPMLDHIARANPRAIDLRFLDRDLNRDLAERVMICGGLRVPTVLFLNEDYEFMSILGDRVLSRYRAIAAKTLGSACALPGAEVPADEVAATVADWVCEFERVSLMLRLSNKLRERHGD